MADRIIFAGIGVLLIALGVPLARRRIRPNGWYGLRIPATFADEQVWYEANALSGRDLMAVGSALIVVAIGLPHILRLSPRGYVYAYTAVLLGGMVGGAFRAWRMANQLWRERREVVP